MIYTPKLHHRKSMRLKGYDYSQAGLYFVTICCHNKKCFYGNVASTEMKLNESGLMIEKWYYELENKFCDIKCHKMVVMPNHFHCIIQNVGADLRVCPDLPYTQTTLGERSKTGEHIGSPLHRVVQWFKTMTTNEYIRGVKNNGWQRFDGKLWQRNYWEHVIRNEQSYNTILQYIINNPLNWENDKLFMKL